jgi:Leucine-rich repeat (LRR) protein
MNRKITILVITALIIGVLPMTLSAEKALPPEPVIEAEFFGISDARFAEIIRNGEIPSNVTRLKLIAGSISDISMISNFTELTSLDLWGNNIRDISPLGNLTNLTELILWGNEFEDITPLANLTNLKTLTLGDNPQFNGDLSALRSLVNLTTLGLGDTWQGLMDYSHLEALVNMEYLQMWSASQLNCLSIIGSFTELKELTIHAGNISNYTPLGNLTNLTRLDLQQNGISDISQLPIDRLTNLTELALWGNPITDITSLGRIKNLTVYLSCDSYLLEDGQNENPLG